MNVEILVDSTPPCKSGLKAKSNKKQRPRSAGHPYTFEREENDRSDGIEQTCSGDFMKNFNDIVCQSMYQVINPHTEAELPSSSQMEFEDDMACNHIDPNATTPPCLLNNPDQTGTVPIIPTLFTNNQQQSYVSPPSNDNAPTSTTVDTEKPNSKLADFKVQDLKGECKKRQLPVSGTKTQLLDRLKPYEDEIFAPTSFTLHEDTDSVDSTIARVAHSHDISLSLTPTATAVIKPCCGNPSCNENSTIPVYFQQPHDVKQPTMRDVINNYLENPNQSLSTIAQNCQRELAKPQQLVLRVPQNSCQQQVVQLVDSNGAVIGVATVMNPPVQQNCCGCMQAQAKVNPGSITDRRRMTVPSMETRVDSGTTGIPLTQPQQINFGHVQANSIPSSNIPSQSTFSFAQLGSGGEFTLVQSTPLNETSCQGCSTTNCLSKQCSLPNHSTPIPTPSIVSPIQIAPKSAIASCHACHQTSQEVTRHPRKEEKLMPISTQRVSDDCCPKRNENQDVQLVRRRSLPSLNINTNQLVSAKSTEDQAREPPKHNPTIEEPKESPDEAKEEEECEEKEVDTSILFTAETMSLHEEMLRFQHKKIAELQEELRTSQNQLRQQQQMILKAKRAQMRQETEEGRIQSPTEAWLKDLDIKQLNKMHIQNFLHLRLQQQQMQNQMGDYQKLATAEQILQEELHIEQAVKDIVRLIKQDARTSLLIVQLLRRYQLERCQQIQALESRAQNQATQSENPVQGQQECDSSQTNCAQPTTITYVTCTSGCCQPTTNGQPQANSGTIDETNDENDIIEIPRSEYEGNEARTVEKSTEKEVDQGLVKEGPKIQKAPKKKAVKSKPETTKQENFTPKEASESSPSSPPSTDEITKKQNLSSLNASSIDMEEIFKNVLEGASRVLRGEDPFDSGKPPTKKKKKASQSTTPPKTENESQPAPKNKPTAKKNKIKSKPIVEEIQMSEPVTMAYSEENMENNLEEGFPCELNFVNGEEFHQVNNYNKLPSCSQLLNPSRDHNIETSINFLPTSSHYQGGGSEFTTVNVDCCGKIDYSAVASAASFNNHQIMSSFVNEPCQATIYFNDQQNIDHVDIDDLLDVLRDDQENDRRSSSQMENTLGYTSDELVNFLSVDWNQNSNEKSQPMSVPPYNFIHSTKSNMSAMDGFSLDSDSRQGSVATVASSESMSDSTEMDFMQQAMDQFNMPQVSNQMLTLPNGNVCLQNNPIFSPMPQNESVENMDWWDPIQNPLMITPDAHSMQLSVNSIQETGFQPMDALV